MSIPNPPPPPFCNSSLIRDDAYYEEWQSPRLGLTYLLLGIAFTITYIPCLIAMLGKDLWSNSCYKIMFSVGILDLCAMCTNAILPGIYMIVPLDYRCFRRSDFLLNIFCSFFWDTYCMIILVLGINRCVQLVSERWSTILFGGLRVWCWVAAACIYGSLFVAVYLSPYGSISFHSGIGLYVWHESDQVSLRRSPLEVAWDQFLKQLSC
uniref:G-protein coupled receptors family 1 profile domain-containing protein n=1 Tax=Plectus sambesii TaxID=2011161 RepID=A0A914VAC0_9BILA